VMCCARSLAGLKCLFQSSHLELSQSEGERGKTRLHMVSKVRFVPFFAPSHHLGPGEACKGNCANWVYEKTMEWNWRNGREKRGREGLNISERIHGQDAEEEGARDGARACVRVCNFRLSSTSTTSSSTFTILASPTCRRACVAFVALLPKAQS